ncbi:MAG: hypothetical protein KatS3mg062_1186 [Tepidiforma sp.]|nr:MAG: hypothetical protein KatS3mg062_1186 [Tepidiforma sp.]
MLRTTGRRELISWGGERFAAFIPLPLPPDPPLQFSAPLEHQHERALLALGRLDAVSMLLPDPDLFLYGYVRREALLSSQIEGTQSSLSDLLLFELDELPGVPLDDVVEVSNYVAALELGLGLLREGLPLSNRLIRAVHGRLLATGRGAGKRPGEFRREPVWIGGPTPATATFVPPPPEEVEQAMAELERFLNSDGPWSALVRAGLAHVQFETIHPFLDGNGRVGRLLVVLVLAAAGTLDRPLLYLSLYFKRNRDRYFALLDAVRERGTWEEWLEFFLAGVEQTAAAAVRTAQQITQLFDQDRRRVRGQGRAANTALRVLAAFERRPLAGTRLVAELTGLSYASADRGVQLLRGLGILEEITGRRRDRLYAYRDYIALLNEGAEPLARR